MSRDIVVVLPDIRSLYNVGSFFRTGDAVGVQKIYLCGTTGTPNNKRLHKVSLGAEQTVPWEFQADPLTCVRALRQQQYQIVAVEKTKTSVDFRAVTYGSKVALVFGAETSGVANVLLDLVDVTVHLPMVGTKQSLNVSVVGGVVLYHLFGS